MTKQIALILTALSLFTGQASADSFDTIKKRLADAACITVDFISVLESSIFESVDSTEGQARIGADGRYIIHLGNDTYLATGSRLYSYSAANNQVTVEPLDPETMANTEITLLGSLDESYISTILVPDSAYRLIRRTETASGLPDSLRVYLNPDHTTIDRLEYFDINEELNRILIRDLSSDAACDTSRFVPDFPDSVEVIELF
jgi:outer membrane lipoprotein-sorting protein